MNQPVRFKSTADYATAELQRLILSGELAPGARIDQVELGSRLDVSRHPIRQAIERLAERGFIQVQPHRSAIVAEISAADLEELYAARVTLETMAIRAAFPRFTAATKATLATLHAQLARIDPARDLDGYMQANRSFHLAMYQDCGNRYILRAIVTMFDLSERYQRTALHHESRMERSARDHADMMAAVTAGDSEALAALIDRHNNGTQATVKALIGTSAGSPDRLAEVSASHR